jgi:photosystem II stability/assembly factor-like uncharacterized protein
MRSEKLCGARQAFFGITALLLLGAVVSLAQTFEPNMWRPLRWRSIGPQRGGRVLAVAGVAGDADVYYFGAVAGGVWKTTNGGENWTPLTDTTDIRSVGAIAVAPSDPNVIYVGTGESCIRGDISDGDGMWKSTDAGKTWTHIHLEDTRHIARIAVDPSNANVVLVAAMGHAFGPNPERGVYRSTDGGNTWTKTLFKDDKTGAIDLSMDPHNSRIVYAALYQFVRTPWGFDSGGPGSGIYRSADGGVTWTQIRGRGLPNGVLGRIGLAVSGADGNRVYAIIEAERGGVYRSDNGGDSWQFLTGDHNLTQRAWYFHHIFADPKNVDTVYVLNTSILRSIDGGHTFANFRGLHGDNHGFWIDPTNPDWIINSNDGGASVTHNAGRTWSTEDNQPTAEFYHVDTDSRIPYMVYGAQQDNSTVAISSRGGGGRGGGGSEFYDVGGGESGWVVPKRDNPDVTYAGSYDGLLTEYNHATGASRDINPWPLNPMGSGAADIAQRFQWTFPIATSPHDPSVIYAGSQFVLMSNNGGSSWTPISPDITRNDKSKQGPAGGSLSHDNTSVEYYDTVFCIAESPLTKGEIWAGTDDGLVQLTRDGGKTWANVSPKGIPEWIKVSIVEPSAISDGTAYVALDSQKLDDMRPYIYKTSDFGKSWTKIINGIPDGVVTHSVKADPKKKGLLVAGTESGVYVSFDDGANWKSFRLNMPNTPVHDLVFKDNDLVIATHGRAFYSLDNISALREMSADAMNADVHVFTPIAAIRGGRGGGGLTLDYWLKAAPQGPVSIEISDSSGKVIRTFTSAGRGGARGAGAEGAPPPEEEAGAGGGGGGRGGRGGFGGGATPTTTPGLNRFTWDLRTDPPSEVPGAVYWAGRGGGAVVPTGTYNVKITAGGQSYTTKVEVKTDPRIHVSQADLDKQFQFATELNQRITAGHDAINQIRGLRQQIVLLKQRLPATPENKAITDAADALDKRMTEVEEELIQTKSTSGEDALNFPIKVVNQLVALVGSVESADAAPTAQAHAVFEVLNKKLTEQLAKWDEIQKKDLADFNAKMRQANVPGISVPPAQPAGAGGRGGRRGG